MNGDRKPDLATANVGPDTTSIFLNNGDGIFRAKVDYRTGGIPESIAIGDLNKDGKPDLATANRETNTASMLLNRGDATFQAKLDYRTADANIFVAISDLDGDGRLDLAAANPDSDTVSVLLNSTGLCTVPNLKGKTLPAAKRVIMRAHCSVGKIRRANSRIVKLGHVMSQKPNFGAVLPKGGKVNLVISRGRER